MTHSNDPENPPEIPNAAPPPSDNRRRLRELLSIPERDRSDEQWDEIIELEIQLAPGNRISGNESGPGGRPPMPQGKPGGGGGNAQKKHRSRANNNRRLRQNKPPSGGGNPPA
ncbi:hypothetical protein [Azonexus sp.]|jgi:hypothetical protein|uniref:hypothetical protein n=1 Tax=Azonexus sp. TaxID=1872668 RepID=UPI002821412F|nr:hypothetical protein [Azonexus sp.]MDR1996631.1 hypothetical protein [Azonexus sp.]